MKYFKLFSVCCKKCNTSIYMGCSYDNSSDLEYDLEYYCNKCNSYGEQNFAQ